MPIFDTKSCGCTSPDLIVEVPEKKHVGAHAWGGVAEMQKAADISVLFFSAGANF